MPAPTEITVVTDQGQVSIPDHLRRGLALVKGQRLLWERVGERELRLTILKPPSPRGVQAIRGFARRFRKSHRATAEWMAELRQGEEEWPGSSTPAS